MNKFEVTYYDGLSSRGIPAVLTFELFHWLIVTDRGNGLTETVRWEVSQVKRNETASGVNTFRYTGEPPQVIESRDTSLLSALREHYPNQHFIDKKYVWLTSTGPLGIFALVAAILGLIAVIYFFVLPAGAGLLANTIPRSTESAIGKSLYESIISNYEINDSLTAQVNDYVKHIDFDTDYPIVVTVVNQDELNAFALPGGHVLVYSKLLDEMKRHEELAAMMSHEVAHVKYRHSLRAMARNLSGYLFISLIIGDANAVMAVIIDNADMLNRLSFSRSLERQADEDAVATLKRNNIDIHGMVDLFNTLKQENKFDLAEFLSTHPLTDERIDFANEQAQLQGNIVSDSTFNILWRRIKSN